jgi:predicted alpha/beta superfamily hydrolase
MKNIVLLLCFSISMFSQKTTESIISAKLEETREITIGLPASYEKDTSKKYPVLVLLDGEYLFDSFNGALSYGNYWDELPETIIVGINQQKNGKRYSDCKYEPLDGIPYKTGVLFFEFIAGELLPYIDKKYRTTTFRTIAGHDITAAYLNFFLYKDYPLFNAYISISPELSPIMESVIPEKLSRLRQPTFYYQSVAAGDIKQLQEPAKNLDQNIKQIDNPNLEYKFDYFDKASHYSLVLYSIPNALYHIYNIYKPITSLEFTEKLLPLNEGHSNYLKEKYKDIKNKLSIKIPVRLNDFKAIEVAILNTKAYPELDQLAEIASDNYPKSMLSYYYLGLMYEKMGDPKKAAKKYQQASQLDEIADLTQKMMLRKYDEMKSQIP